MKKLLLILPFIIFSCRSVKQSTNSSIVVGDAFRLKTTTTIIPAKSDTIIIPQPCDSLGQLSNFKFDLSIPNGVVSLKSDSGKIKYIVKTKEVIHTDTIQIESKQRTEINTEYKEIIKYRIPNWIIYIVLIETLIIIAYIVYKKLHNATII